MAERLPGPTRATVVSAALAGTRPTAKPSGVSTRSGGDSGSKRLSATRSRFASAAWNSGSRPSRSAAAAALCRSSSNAASAGVQAGFETAVDAAGDTALSDSAESPERSSQRHDGQRQEGPDQLDLEAPQHVRPSVPRLAADKSPVGVFGREGEFHETDVCARAHGSARGTRRGRRNGFSEARHRRGRAGGQPSRDRRSRPERRDGDPHRTGRRTVRAHARRRRAAIVAKPRPTASTPTSSSVIASAPLPVPAVPSRPTPGGRAAPDRSLAPLRLLRPPRRRPAPTPTPTPAPAPDAHPRAGADACSRPARGTAAADPGRTLATVVEQPVVEPPVVEPPASRRRSRAAEGAEAERPKRDKSLPSACADDHSRAESRPPIGARRQPQAQPEPTTADGMRADDDPQTRS